MYKPCLNPLRSTITVYIFWEGSGGEGRQVFIYVLILISSLFDGIIGEEEGVEGMCYIEFIWPSLSRCHCEEI